ncbi:MAG TPA: dockerin type I repeat-containing protein, partial [Tepidisphaeraceae bacterium]|nr:dockerin type I repeat-containing protein [Tepidisphaeraceae bacterium]
LNLTGSSTASWSGQTVDATSLLLTSTLLGDANLDHQITPDDYALLDRSFAKNLADPQWTDGDFNYDGLVNSADYLLLDTTYLSLHPSAAPSILSQRESQFGDTYVQQLLTSIPEPSLLAACGLALPRLPRLPRKLRKKR